MTTGDEGWITDWDNFIYPFSDFSWTNSYTSQVHIGRQNEDYKTLCGRDSTRWTGANPEPDDPDPDKCYASCKICVKIYNRLRARSSVGE